MLIRQLAVFTTHVLNVNRASSSLPLPITELLTQRIVYITRFNVKGQFLKRHKHDLYKIYNIKQKANKYQYTNKVWKHDQQLHINWQ